MWHADRQAAVGGRVAARIRFHRPGTVARGRADGDQEEADMGVVPALLLREQRLFRRRELLRSFSARHLRVVQVQRGERVDHRRGHDDVRETTCCRRTTYHGACGAAVWRIMSSYASMYSFQ